MLELTYHTYNKISIENINNICDIPSQNVLQELYQAVIDKNIKKLCTLVHNFQLNGYYSLDVLLHFIQFIKNLKFEKTKLFKNITLEEELLELKKNNEKKLNKNDPEEFRMNLINTLSNYAYIMSKSSSDYIQLTRALLSSIV
jgi:DNA polymerase III gamma/tau subunit